MNSCNYGPVVFCVVITLASCSALSKSGSSLFDELPMNGALSMQSQHGGGNTVFIKPQTNPSQQSSSVGHPVNIESPKSIPSPHNARDAGASLFDELPNQGAFPIEDPNEVLTRNTRGSFFNFDGRGSMDFELGPLKQKPSPPPGNVLQGKNIHNYLRKPVNMNSLFSQTKPVSVLKAFHPPRLNFQLWGQHQRSPSVQTQQQQPSWHQPQRPAEPHVTHFHQQKLKTSPFLMEKFNRSFSQVSANAAGPTVIVYASPDGRRDHPQQKLSNGADVQSSLREDQNNPSKKNEIHYHYHFGDDGKNKTKVSKSKRNRRPSKGWKSKPQEMEENGGGEMPSEGGGYGYHQHQASSLPIFHDSNEEDDSSSSSSSEEEDYEPERDHDTTRRTPNKSEKPKPEPRASSSFPLTYDQPPSQNEPIPPPSYEKSEYSPPSKYGPPPPSQSYGPPAPPPSAGPPAPPENDSPLVAEDKYHTTISLQTIPITRQVTEFVQVPNIIHHISSSQQSSINNDQPVQDEPQPPSQQYGPPPQKGKSPERQLSRNRNRSPTPPPSQSGFQAHLSKLFSSTGISSDNTVASGGIFGAQRNRNQLADSELLELLSLTGSGAGGALPQSHFAPLSHQYSNSLLSTGSANIFGASRGNTALSNGIRQVFPIITGPGPSSSSNANSNVETLKEIIREQRYQNILNELRSRVREESKSADRARSDYRSLFSRGAFLLSALTLLPRVVSPFAAATAAAGGASTLTNYMLPLIPATGRRKRSLNQLTEMSRHIKAFEKCFSKYKRQ